MASAIIHIAIAKEINKELNKDEEALLIGTIAPDLAKLINESKVKSHFLDNDENIPNIEKFLAKYQNNLNDSFVLGYYIHLYTDYLWFKYFLTEISDDNMITKLDGEKIKLNGNMKVLYIYNDYTNLNIELIKKYNIDIEFLYNYNLDKLSNIIAEIDYHKLDILFNQINKIIENSKKTKEFVFNLENVDNFIVLCSSLILSELEYMNII